MPDDLFQVRQEVDLYCTGQSVHDARQLLYVLDFLRSKDGQTAQDKFNYEEQLRELNTILRREKQQRALAHLFDTFYA